MSRQTALYCLLSTVLIAFTAGCNDPTPATGTAKGSDAQPATASTATAAANETPGLKELDEADRKLAEKQKFCPVSGAPLGSMDKPYKITVKGRTFFLCCSDCEDEVKKDPDKYLKKLDALLAPESTSTSKSSGDTH